MAVYTEIDDAELDALAQSYGLGTVLTCKGIAEGVENSNYLLGTESGQFILTIYEKRVDADDLPFFLGLLEHLAANGVPCPVPLHDGEGRNLTRLSGKPAAIVTFLDGIWPKRPRAGHCHELGRAMARMHLASEGYTSVRPNTLSVAGWKKLLDDTKDKADTVKPGLSGILQKEFDHLQSRWPETLPAGIIHADLFPDNVFFIGENLSGLIDFYFACHDAFAYDLAICINAWCFENHSEFNITNARRLLQGYVAERGISDAEYHALPDLCRGAALRFLLTRLYDWLYQVDGALVKPKDPLEYLHRLYFHQQIRDAGAYGLDP